MARGGRDTIYDALVHPRSKFSFGANTRREVLAVKGNNPQYVGHRLVSVRDSASGQQVSVEAVQLDHQGSSWTNISDVMMRHNAQASATGVTDRNVYYSLWDAKMYYNDQPNLAPAQANLNAAAGGSGVTPETGVDTRLGLYIGQIQTSWMNLQQGLSSVGTGLSDDAAAEVAGLLAGVRDAMYSVTDRLF